MKLQAWRAWRTSSGFGTGTGVAATTPAELSLGAGAKEERMRTSMLEVEVGRLREGAEVTVSLLQRALRVAMTTTLEQERGEKAQVPALLRQLISLQETALDG